jgi:hypothetical protein
VWRDEEAGVTLLDQCQKVKREAVAAEDVILPKWSLS